MPRNGSGTYTLPAGNPVVSGDIIESSWANSTLSDLADSITNSLARNGEGGMTAPLRVLDGTVTVPGLGFVNETGSGLYRAAAGDLGLAVLGARVLRLQAAGASVTGTLGVSGLSTLDSLGVTNNAGFGINSPVGRVDAVANAYGVFVARSASAGTNVDVIGFKAVDSAAANFANVAYQAKSHVWGYNGSTFGMVLDVAGNLGIGTSSPVARTEISGSEAIVSLRVNTQNSGVSASTYSQIQLADVGIAKAYWRNVRDGTGATQFAYNSFLSFLSDAAGTSTERARIDVAGNFGVGTSSPAQRLSVSSSANDDGIRITNTSTASTTAKTTRVSFYGTDTANNSKEAANIFVTPGGVNYIDTNMLFMTRQGDAMYQRMSIDTFGCVLVGTTSGLGGQLDSLGNGRDGVVSQVTNNNNSPYLGKNSSGSLIYIVSGAGTIFAVNTTVQSVSDVRTKENIRDSSDGLQIVMGLQPRRFDFKAGFGGDRKNVLGFIAQEIEPIFPDAVDTMPSGSMPDSPEDPYKSVGPGALVPVLVKAIQEQQAIITKLQADVAAIKPVSAA